MEGEEEGEEGGEEAGLASRLGVCPLHVSITSLHVAVLCWRRITMAGI